MRLSLNEKMAVMTECLTFIKQIPFILEAFNKDSSKDSLLQLIKYSNRFLQIANEQEKVEDSQISLFHRFCYRIREVVSWGINYYTHLASFPLIKQILLSINNIACNLKQPSKYYEIFQQIGMSIRNFAAKLSKKQRMHTDREFMRDIANTAVQVQYSHRKISQNFVSDSKVAKQLKYELINEQKKLTKIILKSEQIKKNNGNSQQQGEKRDRMTSQYSIMEVGNTCVMRQPGNSNKEQLIKQCTNRNKEISQIIKDYEKKYKQYKNRLCFKRNRQNIEAKNLQWDRPDPPKIKLKFKNKTLQKQSRQKVVKNVPVQEEGDFLITRSATQNQVHKNVLLQNIQEARKKHSFHLNTINIGSEPDNCYLTLHQQQGSNLSGFKTLLCSSTRKNKPHRIVIGKTQKMRKCTQKMNNSSNVSMSIK